MGSRKDGKRRSATVAGLAAFLMLTAGGCRSGEDSPAIVTTAVPSTVPPVSKSLTESTATVTVSTSPAKPPTTATPTPTISTMPPTTGAPSAAAATPGMAGPTVGVVATTAEISVQALLAEMRQALGLTPDKNGAVSEPPTDISGWLQALEAKYDAKQEPFEVTVLDRAGDGGAYTWAAVMKVQQKTTKPNDYAPREAVGITVTKAGGGLLLGVVSFPEGTEGNSRLDAVADLNGDRRPELVWCWNNVGAHTVTSGFIVTTWDKETLQIVPGEMTMPGAAFSVNGDAIVLKGGIISSAGAGTWQRESTDTYRMLDNRMVLTDRTYENRQTAYHRVLDALASESTGHLERAAAEYREAALQTKESYEGLLFDYEKQVEEGGADPQLEARFRDAVHAFARLRLRLLELSGEKPAPDSLSDHPDDGEFASLSQAVLQAETREAAAEAAQTWAKAHPEWLALLNAPFGYANKQWDLDSIVDG